MSSPRVWEGVVLALKILIDAKDIESKEISMEATSRAVAGLPLKQMQLTVSSSAKLKTFLSRYLESLDETSRRLLLVGERSRDEPEDVKDAICAEKQEVLS